MPGIDWIPGLSQIKAAAQAITGDTEGAKRTVENFARECPGVSQLTSVVQLAAGDAEGAWETQKKCLGTVSNVANGIPIVGHAKAIVHHACGDHKGGDEAMNAATRSTVVLGSGAVAAVTTGGIAAIPAGIAAGVAYDTTVSAATGEEQGYVAAIRNVAENPSAGSIIDALAIPAGDGLAGYSGGQMAAKVQVHVLENLRDGALENMDAAATSGEALKFGAEAKALNAEINTIKHGTPYFFDDPKTGTFASEPAASSSGAGAVPVSGYTGEKTQEKENIAGASNVTVSPTAEREDAIDYDSYVEAIITDSNRREAQTKLREQDQQAPKGNLLRTYSNVALTTPQRLSDLLRGSQDPRTPRNNVRDLLRELFSWCWLLVATPTEFPYEVVAQVNSVYTGLYHSFIRHSREWTEVIPALGNVTARLGTVSAELGRTTAANNQVDAEQARDQFREAINRLQRSDREEYKYVQTALVEIQMEMHRFIEQNMTYENYQGRSVNTRGQERLYFRVETPAGTRVMVVCLSSELFDPLTANSRPVRILMTVFFETWDVFTSHGLLETKEEMERR